MNAVRILPVPHLGCICGVNLDARLYEMYLHVS